MPGGHEISRQRWYHLTATARIMKFGIAIELVKVNILCNYTERLSRKTRVPEGKNRFSAKKCDFSVKSLQRHPTDVGRITEFNRMIEFDEY